MSIVIISGTNTDVGKTIATAALAAALSELGRDVSVVKPVQTGFLGIAGGDLDTVTNLSAVTDTHNFAQYPEAMAPVAAAHRAHMPLLTKEDVAERIQRLDNPSRVVLVEGAGGLLVRLGEQEDGTQWNLADLAALLPQAHTVIVAAIALGCLNEAELSVEVARARGMNVDGLIAGAVPAHLLHVVEDSINSQQGDDPTDAISDLDDAITATNLRDMPLLAGAPFLAALPQRAGSLAQQEFQQAAMSWITKAGLHWLERL